MGVDRTTTVEDTGGPGNRWWLPVLLGLLILAIIAGAFFATHRHIFGASATATPRYVTATPKPVTATPKPGPTGTAKPGPTGTPRPGPSATPKPGPTGTARPGPTGTSASAAGGGGSVHTGAVAYNMAKVRAVQQGANNHNPADVVYLNPFQAAKHVLPAEGFKPGFTITAPPAPPAPTPTPFTNAKGQPEVHLTVTYLGKRYIVVLVQPVQKGSGGIWIVVQINPA
jgi:hypothetical protein